MMSWEVADRVGRFSDSVAFSKPDKRISGGAISVSVFSTFSHVLSSQIQSTQLKMPLAHLPAQFTRLPLSYSRFKDKIQTLGGTSAPFAQTATAQFKATLQTWKIGFARQLEVHIQKETTDIAEKYDKEEQKVMYWTSMSEQLDVIVHRMREERRWTIIDLFVYLSKVCSTSLRIFSAT